MTLSRLENQSWRQSLGNCLLPDAPLIQESQDEFATSTVLMHTASDEGAALNQGWSRSKSASTKSLHHAGDFAFRISNCRRASCLRPCPLCSLLHSSKA